MSYVNMRICPDPPLNALRPRASADFKLKILFRKIYDGFVSARGSAEAPRRLCGGSAEALRRLCGGSAKALRMLCFRCGVSF